jgi:hypothetical protein
MTEIVAVAHVMAMAGLVNLLTCVSAEDVSLEDMGNMRKIKRCIAPKSILPPFRPAPDIHLRALLLLNMIQAS